MKLYILVRDDLEPIHKAVQAGHAVAQFMLEHYEYVEWDNGTLVYLSVPNEWELDKRLMNSDSKYLSVFREPFWNNSLTAIALYGPTVENELKDLTLLKF